VNDSPVDCQSRRTGGANPEGVRSAQRGAERLKESRGRRIESLRHDMYQHVISRALGFLSFGEILKYRFVDSTGGFVYNVTTGSGA